MRRRRVERLIVRAETALADGNTDEVREALEEARRLAPGVPQIAALEQALELPMVDLTVAPPESVPVLVDEIIIETAAVPIETRRSRIPLAAAAVLAFASAGAAGWMYRGSSTAAPFTPSVELSQPGSPASAPPPAGAAATPNGSARVHVETVNAAPVDMRTEPVPLDPVLSESPVRFADVQRTEPTPAATSGSSMPASIGRDVEPVPATFAERTASLPPLDAAPPTAITEARTAVALPPPELKAAARPEPVARSERATDASAAVVAEDAAVRGVLNRYASAYSHLDAQAAQEVWPAVNRPALSRAFDGLASQQVSLERCAVDVRGATAHATCAGSATWSPKIGNGDIKTEPRNWTFQLAKAGADWQIVSARVQNK